MPAAIRISVLLPYERVDLARADVKVDSVEDPDLAEALADLPHLEKNLIH
jgi:hypothetical protein